MTKKHKGKTIGEMYAEILANPPLTGRWIRPLSLADVKIIGFTFCDDMHAHAYHFDLMNENVPYLLFDAYANGKVNVILQDEFTAEEALRIALYYGGTEYKPNINTQC